MAAWFPTLYEDEPFFSAVARYSEAMRYPDYRALNRVLYDGFAGRPAGEFPSLLDAFVARLPPGHHYGVATILWEQTPLPFLAPFQLRSEVRAAIGPVRTLNARHSAEEILTGGTSGAWSGPVPWGRSSARNGPHPLGATRRWTRRTGRWWEEGRHGRALDSPMDRIRGAEAPAVLAASWPQCMTWDADEARWVPRRGYNRMRWEWPA